MSEPKPTSDKIVEITSGDREILGISRKRLDYRNQRGCEHPRVTLIEESRLVECLCCGRIEDAFSYLWRLAAAAENLEKWLSRFLATQRLRDHAMSEDSRGDTPSRYHLQRPPKTSRKGREVWDHIVRETGQPPEALHRNLKQVMARDPEHKVYRDAGVIPGWRVYSVEEWVELKNLGRFEVVDGATPDPTKEKQRSKQHE